MENDRVSRLTFDRSLHQVRMDAQYLLWIHVEFLPAHGDLFVSLGCFTATQKHKCKDLIMLLYLFTLNNTENNHLSCT